MIILREHPTLVSVHSTSEFRSSVWPKSYHILEIDISLNQAMVITRGPLKLTLLPWLLVFVNICPPQITRKDNLRRESEK